MQEATAQSNKVMKSEVAQRAGVDRLEKPARSISKETRFGQEPSTNTKSHPYEAWEGTEVWSALEAAIAELVENQDLEEMTPRKCIVGFLAKRLSEAGLK